MKWFDRWFYKQVRKAWDNASIEVLDDSPKRGRLGRGNGPALASTRRVEHNYDDETVITFKVYGANGGKIIEAARYDEKRDTEGIRRYVISEDADLAESLSKIVTMEYLR
jgi:hypothetical protein